MCTRWILCVCVFRILPNIHPGLYSFLSLKKLFTILFACCMCCSRNCSWFMLVFVDFGRCLLFLFCCYQTLVKVQFVLNFFFFIYLFPFFVCCFFQIDLHFERIKMCPKCYMQWKNLQRLHTLIVYLVIECHSGCVFFFFFSSDS